VTSLLANSQAHTRLTEITTALANIQRKCDMDIIPAEYIRYGFRCFRSQRLLMICVAMTCSENVNWGLMQVVYEWARGTVRCVGAAALLVGRFLICCAHEIDFCRDL
jgi:hypothetical protein